MKFKNSTLLVLMFIMLINAIAYGTIIPLLYPYAQRFGLSAAGLGVLFASFSLAQFLATPVLGRLSDKYGRKPVLLICLFGTSVSLAMFASATSIPMLFIARLIDGVTGGNISVAQAVIADSTSGEERAKAFAMLGASFGVGFTLGPAIGGVIGAYGLTAPFWFASALALVGTILGIIILKETLPPEKRQDSHQPLFHFKSLFQALFMPLTGLVLFLTLISSIAQNGFYIGFQAFTVDQLRLNTAQIGLLFTTFGIVNILTQMVGVRILLDKVKSKATIVTVSALISPLFMIALMFATSLTVFIPIMILFAISTSPLVAVLTGLLSERTKAEDQGIVLGINQSYTSLGQIIGPLMAGLVGKFFGIPSVFIFSALVLWIGAIASGWLHKEQKKFDF